MFLSEEDFVAYSLWLDAGARKYHAAIHGHKKGDRFI